MALFGFLALQISATYAKISMGFFQVAAIVILTIQVNQKFIESIDRISYWLYFSITVWIICLIVGLVIFIVYIAHCLDEKKSEEGKVDCYKATHTGILLNASLFAFLTLLLILTVIPLFTSLTKLRKGRMELT